MISSLEIIFWVLMIINAVLLVACNISNLTYNYIFKKKVNTRLKNIEKIVYKEEK